MSIMFEILKMPCSRGPISWGDTERDVNFKLGHQEARVGAIELVVNLYHEVESLKQKISALESENKVLREAREG